ncbi:toxin-antitoxin system YwqK family antitoxin [Gimesia aquarii]|uniref:Antitoxin YwqK n=1 Tax=Gimesia aquarii TaxID=2527964 RepID=A0A517VRK3_9PLAN|nr:hypothetical protein [Gimesia aquarii]QDT95569.1 Putative antitoxin YwqK [Gimesia aquarii]
MNYAGVSDGKKIINGAIVLSLIFLVITILIMFKVANSEPSVSNSANKQENKTIDFAYKKWRYVGPFDQRLDDPGDILRLSMKAILYSEGEPKKRLLELTPLDDEKVYFRILRVQIRPEDRWLSHGTGASWMLDGSRSENQYSLGKQHGIQREWFPNGQLKLKRHWHYNEVLAQKEWDIDGNLIADIKNNPNYKWSSEE